MELLKNSIIKKSKVSPKLNRPILNSKEAKLQKIYRIALNPRGGQFQEFQADYEFSNEAFNLAQIIKGFVERLAAFMKERELNGVLRFFFRNGQLILELGLQKCSIDITYSILSQGLNTQVIVITATLGGAASFTLSWFSVGATLVAPPLRLKTFFIEGDSITVTSIEMEPLDLGKNSALKHDFNLNSEQTFEDFLKDKIKEQLRLVENPTKKELDEIIQRTVNRKSKEKTVFFRDFIDEISNLSDSDIIDAEIVKEPVQIRVKNQ